MSRISSRAGRKDATERIRELVSLLGSLSKTGDSVSIDVIASRMGLTIDEAQAMMDIVCAASGEESSGLLISSNDEGSEFTLQYPGMHGRPLRLTESETVAVIHALDLVGLDEHDPMRERLRSAFTSPSVVEDEVRRALGKLDDSDAQHLSSALDLCARAQATHRELLFTYRGLKDSQPRPRRVFITQVSSDGNRWHVRSVDLDLNEERTFRIDRMSDLELGEVVSMDAGFDELCPSQQAHSQQIVGVTFYDPTYLSLFEWPGLHVIHQNKDVIHATLPYYGRKSTWLVRRIVACSGTLVVDDEEIMSDARSYAAGLLEHLSV